MNKIRKFAALLLTLSAIAFLPASQSVAQELAPEHLALARQYVDLTDQSSIYEVSLIQTGIETMQTLIVQNPEIEAQLDEAIGQTINDFAPRKGELFDQFARVYASLFSMGELQEIVTFYQSDTGQKLAKANATANKDLRAVLKIFEVNLKTEFFAKVRARLRDQGLEI